jgi:hypothetical protein
MPGGCWESCAHWNPKTPIHPEKGTTGEIQSYKEITLRMAPIKPEEIACMANDGLRAGKLFRGFRGAAPIDMEAPIALMTAFPDLLMDM